MTNESSQLSGKLVGSKDNPLAEFINTIPWTPTLVDADLLDSLRKIICQYTAERVIVTNKYVILLMQHLAGNAYLELVSVPVESVPGSITLVQRVK